jgi:hypothetical protein
VNRFLILAAGLALGLVPLAAGAEGPTGLSGTIIDAKTKQPIAGAKVVVARDEARPQEKRQLVTDRHGAFVDIGLRPGGYQVIADVNGTLLACSVNDVREGVVRRVRFEVGPGSQLTCSGPTVTANTLDPDETASLYRIR